MQDGCQGAPYFWQKCVGLMNEFVSDQDKTSLEVPVLTIVK